MNDGQKVSYLPGQLPVSAALDVAKGEVDRGLKEVVILGFYDNGQIFIQGSKGSRADALWLIECAKAHIFGVALNNILRSQTK